MINIKKFFAQLYFKLRNLILYGIFGAFAAIIDYGVYFVIIHFQIVTAPEIASLIGNLFGFLFTFITNTFINFEKKDKLLRRFVSYGLICLAGSGISTLLLYLFKDCINLYSLKAAVMIVICLLQFVLNKFITYKE